MKNKKIIIKKAKKKKEKLDLYGNCPICKTEWGYNNDKSSHIIGIEIPEKYDGISEWMCPFCYTCWDRWTEEIILDKNIKKIK